MPKCQINSLAYGAGELIRQDLRDVTDGNQKSAKTPLNPTLRASWWETRDPSKNFFDTGFAAQNTRIPRIKIGIAQKRLEEASSDRNKLAFFYPSSFSSALI
jgi:hypothetical protein